MKFMFLLALSFSVLLINGKTFNKNFHTDIVKICPGYNCDENLHETERNIDYQNNIDNKNINKIRIKRGRGDKDIRRGYKYLTKEQIEELEDYFQENEKPERLDDGETDRLAKQLKVKPDKIKRWFADRRHNEKIGACIQKLIVGSIFQ